MILIFVEKFLKYEVVSHLKNKTILGLTLTNTVDGRGESNTNIQLNKDLHLHEFLIIYERTGRKQQQTHTSVCHSSILI